MESTSYPNLVRPPIPELSTDRPLQIKFQCVEPGGFRTDWAGRSMDFGEPHPAYDHIQAKEAMGKRHGNQAGDVSDFPVIRGDLNVEGLIRVL